MKDHPDGTPWCTACRAWHRDPCCRRDDDHDCDDAGCGSRP